VGEIRAARDFAQGLRGGLGRGARRILIAVVVLLVVGFGIGALVATLR
jgi:hypothetical protein